MVVKIGEQSRGAVINDMSLVYDECGGRLVPRQQHGHNILVDLYRKPLIRALLYSRVVEPAHFLVL